ncbi:ATP-binding protein [Janibacter sp. UYMM211]|uniref:sensor histidine kinase n=1 Tax=Janibacter sp. UYMM211 TaxID=3156342 RepID=UPI00339250BB
MSRLTFTVDAKLLRELGERLVGRPHIALAELIKNSYDADASTVVITFADGLLRVEDDGHGMTRQTFTDRWMRIGTTVKVRQRVSPGRLRTLTGSKGVGRLSVQLLAQELTLRSVALREVSPENLERRRVLDDGDLCREICADIVWPDELRKKDLTEVGVDFSTAKPRTLFAGGSRCGTSIELGGLVDEWDAEAFRRLAREVWALRPPFAVEGNPRDAFTVTLVSDDAKARESFEDQMGKILDIASATVSGRLLGPDESPSQEARRFVLPAPEAQRRRAERAPTRHVEVKVKVAGRRPTTFTAEVEDCQIDRLQYELRVFDLQHRQPDGIKVGLAREYLAQWGGVHIYDNNFRLPYYGPDVDWLKIEVDHANRRSRSKLLPQDLYEKDAMHDLPTNRRVFGSAYISTSDEQRAAEDDPLRRVPDALAIQVTRDRLADNLAFEQMAQCVRVGLDLYALEQARNRLTRAVTRRRGRVSDPSTALERASEVVEELKPKIAEAEYVALRETLDDVVEDSEIQRDQTRAYLSLLGALATAGMTSLAYEHEISKQKALIRDAARDLRRLQRHTSGELQEEIASIALSLTDWSTRAERIRALFRPLLDEESRTDTSRQDAGRTLRHISKQMQVLSRGTQVDVTGIPEGLKLPPAQDAAWSAVFQNLLTNAFRATSGNKPGRVLIDGGSSGRTAWIRVQDDGDGVDLQDAARLFEPFERAAGIDPRSEALGLGGSGLGLAIVRMILDEVGADVSFTTPDPSWSTAVRVQWKEPR